MQNDGLTSFGNYQAYYDRPYAYASVNRVAGFYQEAASAQDRLELFILRDLEEKAHRCIFYGQHGTNNVYLSLLEPVSVNPAINDYSYCGVDCMVDDSHKYEDELFKKAYDSIDAEDISELDIEGFIAYCEEQYKMSTKDFLKWFAIKGNEGNVEMQLWALYAKNLGVFE